jgi:hypothetical protein
VIRNSGTGDIHPKNSTMENVAYLMLAVPIVLQGSVY